MSVAEWEGIPLAEVVARLKPSKDATGVLVSGFDHIGQNSQRSIVGASWVFPLADLDKLGAFLAIRMNGEPVPADHGKPVRLAVPGWYGCSWIKWVNEIRLVGPDEPATSQMVEFAAARTRASRTSYARDYTPADIQTAATPVRVEKRKGPNGLEYRIVGIVWGGTKPVDRLQIRFGNDQPFAPFSVCPAPKTHTMWSLWEYRWKPAAPGTYDIALGSRRSIGAAAAPRRPVTTCDRSRSTRSNERRRGPPRLPVVPDRRAGSSSGSACRRRSRSRHRRHCDTRAPGPNTARLRFGVRASDAIEPGDRFLRRDSPATATRHTTR